MIKNLSDKEFNATFLPPMNFMDEDDETSGVDLKSFVQGVLAKENIDLRTDQLQIDSIYHNSDKTYEHVLIDYGIENKFIVIVVELLQKAIYGYYLLDLSNQYGIDF